MNWIKENKLVLFVFALNLIFFMYLIFPNQQIPGPIYGGDLYYSMGHSIHIYDGGKVFQSFHDAQSLETYPWLFHLITGKLSALLGIDIYFANLYLIPLILSCFLFFIWYGVFNLIYKNKFSALILTEIALLFFGIRNYYYASSFADIIVLPLILLTMLWYFNDKSLWKLFPVALMIGISGLTQLHLMYFACGLFVILSIKSFKIVQFATEMFMLLIGVAISLLYFYIPVIFYHGNIINNWQQYSINALTFGGFISTFFWNLAGPLIILKLLAWIGICLYFMSKNKTEYIILPIVLCLGLIGIIHPMITNPILHTDFGYYKYFTIVSVGYLLFASFLVHYLMSLIKDKVYMQITAVMLMLIVLVCVTISINTEDKWVQLGYSQQNKDYAPTIYKEVKKVADVNDVFISEHPETLFALNGVSGRKTILIRRTHFNAFADYDERSADLSVILYGNNQTLRQELINKYAIKFIYLDAYSEQNKKICYDNWDKFNNTIYQEQSYSCLQTDIKYKDYLVSNGIEVKEVKVRKDISRDDAQKFPLLIIKPKPLLFNFTATNDYMNQGFLIGDMR